MIKQLSLVLLLLAPFVAAEDGNAADAYDVADAYEAEVDAYDASYYQEETPSPTASPQTGSSWFNFRSSSNKYGAYGYNFFADSSSTYYDGHAQAWRYLGWYVKCGAPSDRYDQGQHSHSGSQDRGNGYVGSNWCQRYLMWAAVSLVGLSV